MLKALCDCGSNSGKGELILAGMVALAELAIFYLTQRNTTDRTDIMEELDHYRDESRYLRTEFNRERLRALELEKENHEMSMVLDSIVIEDDEAIDEETVLE